jgi:homoserine dehydrogenase
VLVRNPDRHRGDAIFTTDAGEALQGDPDLVVELLGGADYPADLMHSALRRGAEVVTANKAAVAEHFDSLHASAEAGGARLRYSGAVGGVAPVLETLERLHGQVVFVEGVMSGTCNYLLSRLGEGISLEAAVIEAQQLGFAEADASADVDSHDAAAKLSILARKAFGVPVPPKHIARQSLASLSPADAQAALANGQILKQVGRCKRLADGRIEAEVAVVALDRQHPLAGARNEANRFLVGDSSGAVHRVFGKGAGRWPTAAAVFADMMDAQRALLQRCEQADSAPVRLSA